MADEVRIHVEILEEMIRHARREPEMECCGLQHGRDGVIITEIFATENALASATAYEIAPRDLFRLFRRLRQEGLEHLGQYHSHLHRRKFPSERDVAQAYYPNEAAFASSGLSRAQRARSAPS